MAQADGFLLVSVIIDVGSSETKPFKQNDILLLTKDDPEVCNWQRWCEKL